jgi:Flp pilus assembly pilin Flp
MIQLFARLIAALCYDEEGQTLVEYALLLTLVGTASFGILAAIGNFPSSAFSSINADF